MRCHYLLTLALLLPIAHAQAAPPTPDFADLPAYLSALNRSSDPEAKLIRQRIADGPAALARERAAAEKEGLLTRQAELQPPLPPAGQNAAPLYLKMAALRKQKPLHFPMYAQSLNGHWAYTPSQIAVVQKEYDARQDYFALLQQATDKPQCVFVLDPADLFGISFTEYANLRESAREVKTVSLLLAYKGNYPQAVASQERGFQIADHAASQPILISFLVGSAIEAITLSGMQEILSLAGPNAALDSSAEKDILALHPDPDELALPLPDALSLHHALSGEAAIADTEFAMLRRAKPAELAQIVSGDSPGSPFLGDTPVAASARFTRAEQVQVGHLIDAAHADYLRQMHRIVVAADLTSAARQLAFEGMDAQARANQDDPIKALSDMLNPVVGWDALTASSRGQIQLDQEADQLTARREVTAAGAAVLAARAQTGAFPDVLPPQFTDPFTGKPLGYRREGASGFVVYSAGPTGTFDGGKPGDSQRGQILFRYPLVPIPVPQDMLK